MVKRKQNTKKKSTTKKNAMPPSRRLLIGVGLLLIVLATISLMAVYGHKRSVADQNQQRYDRIVAIYNSLKLGDDYQVTDTTIFGDKRVYEWDKGRTYSSSVTYVYPGTVKQTVADVDAKIKAAGFTYFDEPYPGSTYTQYHYKSEKGEYIRLTVSSKPYDDAVQNARVLGKEPTGQSIGVNPNTAPSNVLIKVNLDDNNE